MNQPRETLQILRCPVGHGTLNEMTPSEISVINRRAAEGTLLHLDGSPVEQPITAGLVSVDGRFAYRVEGGIFVLLRELAIEIYRLEEMFPRHAGRLGQYPIIDLSKTTGGDAAAA